jgi:hypothetical protein
MSSSDPFGDKRQEMREEFFAKLFLLGGWSGATDTYKLPSNLPVTRSHFARVYQKVERTTGSSWLGTKRCWHSGSTGLF